MLGLDIYVCDLLLAAVDGKRTVVRHCIIILEHNVVAFCFQSIEMLSFRYVEKVIRIPFRIKINFRGILLILTAFVVASGRVRIVPVIMQRYYDSLAGYKPSDQFLRKPSDLRFSLGLMIDNEGDDHAIVDVVPGSPADKAGIGPNMKLLGINGRKFDEDLLKDALAATPKTGHVALLLENATYFINAKLDYNGGPRFPHLERVSDAKDVLTTVIAPRTKPPAEKK